MVSSPDASYAAPWLDRPVFAFSVDTDWAPVELIEELLGLFESRGIRVTVFVTDSVLGIDRHRHELAMHPNITDISDIQPELRRLARLLGEVHGERGHGLIQSYRHLAEFARHGIRYTSNYVLFNQAGIQPVMLTPEILELPIFWMDYIHLEMYAGDPDSFHCDYLDLSSPGLKIFDIHPHHYFLNTTSLSHYERARDKYKDVAALKALSVPESQGHGCRYLLSGVLDWIIDHDARVMTLGEINALQRGTWE